MINVKSLKGLTEDSRAVKDGYLFAAFTGTQNDGRDYIPAAIKNGASHILACEGTQLPVGTEDTVRLITDPAPRKVFAKLAAEFYEDQPAYIAAVTGTNGKTSVVHFTQQIWTALGFKASALGTLQGTMTTPDTVSLHKNLKALSDDGASHLAIEASSHGLDQNRLDGVKIKAAGFTNLSRDHLDYHKDMSEYLAAKMRLFTEVLDPKGVAVINADSAQGQDIISANDRRTLTYGAAGKDLKILSVTPQPQGQKISLEIFEKAFDLTIPLVGDFQIMNALCALGLVLADDKDIDRENAIAALETLKGAKGRLEYVEGHPKSAAIYVDYAHTPDALDHVLNALRPHTAGKLVCVFGCGGDRDRGKRHVMGEIAARLADHVIVTDDNPRSEDPAAIRAEVLKGAKNADNIGDRHEAIKTAMQDLEQGDVLLIAGKGHEQGQVFATHTAPFDDVNETKKIIKSL